MVAMSVTKKKKKNALCTKKYNSNNDTTDGRMSDEGRWNLTFLVQ
jgi:hypothetical protein